MKDLLTKNSPKFVPEGSVIQIVRAMFYNLRRKGDLGCYRSPYLNLRLKLKRDVETLMTRVKY